MSATITYRRNTTVTNVNSLLNDLLGYWKLEETSGTLYDELGNVNMTSYSSPTYHVTGKLGYAMDFSPSATTCIRNSGSEIYGLNPNGDEYTIQVWAYLASLPSVVGRTCTMVRSSLDASPWENIVVRIDTTNKPTMRFTGTSDNNYCFYPYTVTASAWHHYVFIVRGAGTYPIIYVDNNGETGSTLQNGDIYDVSGSTAGFNIGNAYGGASISFNGVIDEVAIWRRALTPDEVATLYNSGTGLTYPFI